MSSSSRDRIESTLTDVEMEVDVDETASTPLAVLAVVLGIVPFSALARGRDLTLLQICFRVSMAAVKVLAGTESLEREEKIR